MYASNCWATAKRLENGVRIPCDRPNCDCHVIAHAHVRDINKGADTTLNGARRYVKIRSSITGKDDGATIC